MRHSATTAVLAVAIAVSACYHATIETGLPLSLDTVEDGWADGWVLGLVPPKTVELGSRCPNGIAKVETHLSFVNQLVGLLTIGIYTPMNIKVTCAGTGRAGEAAPEAPTLRIDAEASLEETRAVFSQAAELSAEVGRAVLVSFD